MPLLLIEQASLDPSHRSLSSLAIHLPAVPVTPCPGLARASNPISPVHPRPSKTAAQSAFKTFTAAPPQYPRFSIFKDWRSLQPPQKPPQPQPRYFAILAVQRPPPPTSPQSLAKSRPQPSGPRDDQRPVPTSSNTSTASHILTLVLSTTGHQETGLPVHSPIVFPQLAKQQFYRRSSSPIDHAASKNGPNAHASVPSAGFSTVSVLQSHRIPPLNLEPSPSCASSDLTHDLRNAHTPAG